MLLAERSSSKFHSCPRLEALLLGQLFIFWTILQPWALSSDILAAGRGLCLLRKLDAILSVAVFKSVCWEQNVLSKNMTFKDQQQLSKLTISTHGS